MAKSRSATIVSASVKTLHNLLSDPLFTVQRGEKEVKANLPEILAWYGEREDLQFPKLRAYQQHPWHAFLVQLAALAVVRAIPLHLDDDGNYLDEPGRWRAALLQLTDGKEEPWCLVVGDPRKPAFMQPAFLDDVRWTAEFRTPGALDILITGKNHDIKIHHIAYPDPEHWVFALVTAQTFPCYSGRFTFGVSRSISHGTGNRVCVGIIPGPTTGARFMRDINIWLSHRQTLTSGPYGLNPKGHTLLWQVPWDGSGPLEHNTLDPFFIEICRRVRLFHENGEILARRTTSAEERVQKFDGGDSGDIWTPVSIDPKTHKRRAFTAMGFPYYRLSEILFQQNGWVKTPNLNLDDEATFEDPWIIAQALARAQGKTVGYHERRIPLPRRALDFLKEREGFDKLAARSQDWISRARDIHDRLIRIPLLALIQGAPLRLNFRDRRYENWKQRFEQRVDDVFFAQLFASLSLTDDQSRLGWDEILERISKEILMEAKNEIPLPSQRRYPILAAADSLFAAALRDLFRELETVRKTEKSNEAA